MSIDIEHKGSLADYLRDKNLVSPDDRLAFTTLTGGVSNRAILVNINGADRWVVKQALEKLRVPVDWFSSPERIHREAEGLRTLADFLPQGTTPGFVYEDEKTHILVMDAIPQPHTNWKSMLIAGQVHTEHMRQFGTMLATIHSRAYADYDTLATRFADRHFFETLRIEPYYRYSAEQVPQAANFIVDLINDTQGHAQTLVHGDYSPKNILIYDNRLVLLDHEVIHWGDPAFDIGFSMTHLLSKAHHLVASRATFEMAALNYWDTYKSNISALFDKDFEARCVRHTLGCLLARVAGRSQLEYMSTLEKAAQCDAVLRLMQNVPTVMPELIKQFIEDIHDNGDD